MRQPRIRFVAYSFIDPQHKLRLTFTYPAAVGRNFNEILRWLDALQLSNNYGIRNASWGQDGTMWLSRQASKWRNRREIPKGHKEIKALSAHHATTE